MAKWISRTSPSDAPWCSICYGAPTINSVVTPTYVAVSTGGQIMTSKNGISNWTLSTVTPAGKAWTSVCYGNGIFVAISSDATSNIMTSPDGITWTQRNDPTGNTGRWLSICYGDGKFFAVAKYYLDTSITGYVMYSTNGIDWTYYSNCFPTGAFSQLSYQIYPSYSNLIQNGTFAVPDITENSINVSPTGVSDWTFQAYLIDRHAISNFAIPYPNNTTQAALLEGNGTKAKISQNVYMTAGITYNLSFYAAGRNVLPSFYSNPVNIKLNSNILYTFTPPTTDWLKYSYYITPTVTGTNTIAFEATGPTNYYYTAITSIVLIQIVNQMSICYGNNKYVDVSVFQNVSGTMTSSNGLTWTAMTLMPANYWRSVCYGNNVFVAVGDINSVPAVSSDGLSWTSANSNTPLLYWQSVCFGDGIFVAVANTGTGSRAMTSSDGINWTLQTTAADNDWRSICYGGFTFAAVAASGTGNRIMTSESPSLTCYLIGTRILCLVDNIETYVPIENIRKGTLIKTYNHGYIPVKLIGKRNCINNMTIAQNCLYKMKETGLSITGAHSILVDKLPTKLIEQYEFYTKNHKIEDKYILLACDSDLFEPFADCNEYTLYHLCLESESPNDHFGIWAEGVLSESTSENDYNDGFFVNTG